MKQKVRNIALQILSVAITIALCMGAWWLGLYLSRNGIFGNDNTPIIAVFATCGTALVILIAVNIIGSRIITNKLSGMKTHEIYHLGERLKSKTESDLKRAEKSVRLTIAFAFAYVVSVILILLICCFCTGALMNGENELSYAIAIMIVAIFITWGLMNVFFTPLNSPAPPAIYLLDENRFPLIYKTVREAAEKSGCRFKVKIYCCGEDASVSTYGRTAIICIHYLYAALLTRDELYNVMLHEFAHIVNADVTRSRTFATAEQRFESNESNPIVSLGKLILLNLFSLVIEFKTQAYNTFANRSHEIEADKALKELGNPQSSINALAKTAMIGLFFSVPHRELDYDFFAPEKLTGDYALQELALFLKHRELHEKEWRETLEKELPARVDSHPTFKSRMVALDCDEYDACQIETDCAYVAEQREIIGFADKIMNDNKGERYGEIRENAYVNRKKIIDEYEEAIKNGKEIPDNKLYEYIQAFFGVDDDIALKLADRAASLPNPTVAQYYKANILFNRNDDGCIELLKAVAANTDDYELAMSATKHLGEYALKTGNEELLKEYRSTTADVVQASLDKSERTRFDKRSTVEKCDIDSAVLSEIINGIGEELLNEVTEIYVGTFIDADGGKHYPVTVCIKGRKSAVKYELLQKLYDYFFGFKGNYEFMFIPPYSPQSRKVIKCGSCVFKK